MEFWHRRGRTKKSASHEETARGQHNLKQPQRALLPLCSDCFSLIYFFEKEKYKTAWSELWDFICTMEHIRCASRECESDGALLVYSNEQTGVEAEFRGYLGDENALEAGVEFILSVPRPQCFAYETLPLAVRVAREFHVIVKMRNLDGTLTELPATTEGLLLGWRQRCEEERVRRREQGCREYKMRSENLDSVWEHQYLLDELQSANRSNECVMLNVEYVCRKRTGELQSMCRWPDLLPAVFPPVDLVMLVDPPKPLQNGRIYETSVLFQKTKEWIKTEHFPIAHKVYVRTEPSPEFIDALAQLKGVTMRSFESINWLEIDDT